jgi:hypothetical protein
MTRYIHTDGQRQFAQNIAAISGDFHTHRLYPAFYDTFGRMIDGFIGNYEICIQMVTSLTDWEIANGATLSIDSPPLPTSVLRRCRSPQKSIHSHRRCR